MSEEKKTGHDIGFQFPLIGATLAPVLAKFADATRPALSREDANRLEDLTRKYGGSFMVAEQAVVGRLRNCDLYSNWETAIPAWAMETGEEVDSKTGFADNAQLKRFLDWLFAQEEGETHE